MPKFNQLRRLGAVGNALANVLTFLTANWAIAVSVAAAIAAGAIDWLRGVLSNPATMAGVVAFLSVLWTIVGITVLVDRRRPRAVRTHIDYRYGLTFEGFQPRYVGKNEKIPDAGSLHFGVMLRNYSPSPIRCEFEHADIRIGTRAIPRIRRGTLTGFMARGSGRTSILRGFAQNELKEFYGNTDPVKGSAELSIVYGPPEGPPERQLKIIIDTYLVMINDGDTIGWQDNITEETDEPF